MLSHLATCPPPKKYKRARQGTLLLLVLLTTAILTGCSRNSVESTSPPVATHSRSLVDELKLTPAEDKINRIDVAIFSYETVKEEIPRNILDRKGERELLSWRVRLLPYLEEERLYNQFHLDEPRDSPHNISLVAKMPDVFRLTAKSEAGKTTVLAVRGKDTVFDANSVRRFEDIPDGFHETVFVVTTGNNKSITWTQPADLSVDVVDPVSSLGQLEDEEFLAIFADGNIRRINRRVSPGVLWALMSSNGGEKLKPFGLLEHVGDTLGTKRESVPPEK